MAIVLENEFGWFVEDKKYFDQFYHKVYTNSSAILGLDLKYYLFHFEQFSYIKQRFCTIIFSILFHI